MIEPGNVYQMDALALLDGLPERGVDAFILDLPYGTTQAHWDSVIPIEPMWAGVKRALKPNGVFVTTAAQPFSSILTVSNLKMFKYEWIWAKNTPSGFLNSKKQPLRAHESVLVFYAKQPTYNLQYRRGERYEKINYEPSELYRKNLPSVVTDSDGKRFPKSVIYFNNQNGGGKINPTQKPLALFAYLIKTYTNPGDLVVDFCCGSGTTGIAAKALERRWILNDNDPDQYRIARIRLGLE